MLYDRKLFNHPNMNHIKKIEAPLSYADQEQLKISETIDTNPVNKSNIHHPTPSTSINTEEQKENRGFMESILSYFGF